MHSKSAPRTASAAGFTLVETLLIVALVGIIAGISIVQFQATLRQLRADANVRIIQWQLTTAREMAMNQRRDMQIQFLNPSGVAAIRQEIPNGTTLLSTVYLEGNVSFRTYAGLPDTPDGFGNTAPVSFGSATTLKFTSDGAFVDQSGRAVNGSIFFGVPSQVETARAITIFGATGRVRSWRWQGRNGWMH